MSQSTWYDHSPPPALDELLDTVRRIASELDLESTGDVADDLSRILGELRVRNSRRRGGRNGKGSPKRRGRKAWPPELRETFRKRFLEALEHNGLADNLHPLADELDVNWDNVYCMRRGRTAPSPPQLVVIADVLRVSIDWLLGRRKDRGR